MKTFPAVHLLVLGRSELGQWGARELAEGTGVKGEIREAASQVVNGLLVHYKDICFHSESDGKSLQGFG